MVSFKVFLLVPTFLWTFIRADTDISCDFMQSCILPCSFQAESEEIIHWILTAGNRPVYSYYYNQNQLAHQDQTFKGRTSLFKEQISRGNASLQLTGVQVQDQGRYKCYTSTIRGNKETYINLRVDAPVSKIHIEQVGNRITCSSEGIYPEPEITWSTNPPSTFKNTTTVQQTEQQLYNISSSLILSDHVPDVDHSCSISTRRNSRRATRFKQTSINGSSSETIPCAISNQPITSFLWRFNHSQIIVENTGGTGRHSVSEEWRPYVKQVSDTGSLTLQDLTPDQGGIYTCEASDAEETRVSNTILWLEKQQDTSHSWIVGLIVAAVFAAAAVAVIVLYRKNKLPCCKQDDII
ncbi:hypothetical protein Q8A73_020692 [Channa argus]|nr:hypothetical protein Q8A73_020692 [Channa argus]